jgi:hypothetical protein
MGLVPAASMYSTDAIYCKIIWLVIQLAIFCSRSTFTERVETKLFERSIMTEKEVI